MRVLLPLARPPTPCPRRGPGRWTRRTPHLSLPAGKRPSASRCNRPTPRLSVLREPRLISTACCLTHFFATPSFPAEPPRCRGVQSQDSDTAPRDLFSHPPRRSFPC